MHLAAVPIVHRISFQRVIVFMIAADEGQREGQAFQPVQRFIVAAVTNHTPPKSPVMMTVSSFVMFACSGKQSDWKRRKFPWQSPVT